MKFLDEKDQKLFELSYDSVDDFYQKVKDLKKSFRRSQVQKHNWRAYRYRYMKGIKAFHRSTRGKRFHRWLSRYLALKYRPGYHMSYKKHEAIKALSSLITHLAIEADYYHPLMEHVEILLMIETATDWIIDEMRKVVEAQDDEIPDFYDLVLTFTDPYTFFQEVDGAEVTEEQVSQFYSEDVAEWPLIGVE